VGALLMITASLLVIVCSYILLGLGSGLVLFFVGAWLLNAGWNAAVSVMIGVVATLDTSGRATVLYQASVNAGTVVGPALFGVLLERMGADEFGVGLACAGGLLPLALVLFIMATQLVKKSKRDYSVVGGTEQEQEP
jgi:predicted MFS family arabinose efflux permease